MVGQFCRGVAVLSERFLHNDPGPAGGAHAGLLSVGCDRLEDRRRQRQVEQAVCRRLLVSRHLLVEDLEVPLRVVAARNIVVQAPEGLSQLLLTFPDLQKRRNIKILLTQMQMKFIQKPCLNNGP